MTTPPRDLAAIVGGEVTAMTPLRWGFAHHTDLVSLADGRQVVVKRFAGPAGGAELRRAVVLAERLTAAGIPTPSVLSAHPDRDPPILVLGHVRGETGADWLDTDARARTLAQTMGRLAVRLRDVPTDRTTGSDDRPWSDPTRLAVVAFRWLERLGPDLAPATSERLAHAIEGFAGSDASIGPRLAHGDFVPVNVLLGPDGSLAGVLDLGSWRVAHPWLDVAWWGWVVRSFHPEAWAASWPTMLVAAGVPDDGPSAATLHRLGMIRCLEWAATSGDPAAPSRLNASVAWPIRG